ncbi:hypothetical protein IB259_00100 [Achromobacter sp. ACM04]|uniref:hypothetical protein n=1 Tax=Achromobacter sp. ACM04 TaxID=2769312 RepID=UPI0017832C79|nr:hypothetical protein [Achromobacter sp. ACM04]MBD9417620.1 hypothetical protein [Achromobacter sp. ACM04]
MTNQNNAAQAAEQEIDAIMEQAQVFASAWAFLGGPFDNGSGLETAEREKANLRALLSKLRAPVADERDAARYRWLRKWKGQEHEPPFTVQHEELGPLWLGDLDHAIDTAMDARAALASASMPECLAETALRTIAEYPVPEQDNMPAHNMRAVAVSALASAPVAGEAVAYRVGTDLFLPEALPAAERYAEIRQKPLEPLYAAPQASEAELKEAAAMARSFGAPDMADALEGRASEAVRDTALTALQAARQFISNGIELGFIRMPDADVPDPAHRTPGLIDAAIRALSAQPGAQKEQRPWQAIDTAPKDQVILLFGGLKKDGKIYAPHINVGYWTEQFGWTCLVYAHQEFAHIEPTHWMPRPPFPAQAHPDNKDGGAVYG